MGGGAILKLAWVGAVAGPLVALAWAVRKRRIGWFWRGAAVLLAIVYGLCVWSFLVEPKLLVVRHVEVASPAWRGAPLRIGMVSDTHVGAAHMSLPRLRSVVGRLNRERPDVVVLLGDYAGGHEPAALRQAPERSEILRGAALLGEARAPLGMVAVLGNHDWWYDGRALEAQLQRVGVRVLENEAVRLERAGGSFWLAGLGDLESRRARPSVMQALRDVPDDEPVVVLSHWPDPFAGVPPRVALTLAGHTHCGQVNLPIFGRVVHASRAARRWGCGLYDEGGRQLYVTGGLGVSILPVRFRAPPEIVLLTLRGASPP